MLQIHNLSISFGSVDVLKKVSLDLAAGEILAVTGANGAGKSTLLKSIKGEITPSEGKITIEQGIDPLLVNQEIADFHGTVKEYLLGARKELFDIHDRLGSSLDDPMTYAELINEFHNVGGFEFETKISSSLNEFGVNVDSLDFPYMNLSHGQKRILSLVRGVLSGSSLFLLDEPTNHLDIEMTLRLEEIITSLSERGVGVIVVSHDRRFIDRVAHKTIYLKRGEAIGARGGYSEMLAHLESDFLSRQKKSEEISKKIRQLELDATRRKSWSDSREASKRSASDKGHEGHMAAKLARRALAVQKRTERLIGELECEKPFVEKPVTVRIPKYGVPNRKMVMVDSLSFSYEENEVIREASVDIDTSDRVGLMGPNGSGKTTLMKCLVGILEPSGGRIYRNESVNWMYIPQNVAELFENTTPYEEIADLELEEPAVRSHLANIGLKGEKAFSEIKTLSYGELMRLALLKSLLSKVEFIFMDEPTNHLDIESLEVLDRLLNDFSGGFFFISHDRQFIAEHGEKILTIEEGILKSFEYSEKIDIDSFSRTKEILADSYDESKLRRSANTLLHNSEEEG
ncbi:MAG TPA: ABC-F family ATP-binding cassette domain-containing protein [Mesotoga infera]|uniref:ABC-F family ATP-binding cassette domain-containing protein n=1 Tax=Mesotoga infera TaxID=1236046 RepID=A0A7C1CWG0_9BACT|nr:ABC-F family ATP-binding cassette domain-containing protein [Mesotoga infera]